jgi:hypothetical protein
MRDALNRYYRALKKTLDCPKQTKIRFLGQTQRLVEDFVEGKPDARFEDVYGFLGDPAALAETFLSTLDPEEISRYRPRRLREKTVVGLLVRPKPRFKFRNPRGLFRKSRIFVRDGIL